MAAPTLFAVKSPVELSLAYAFLGDQQRTADPKLAHQSYSLAIQLNPENQAAYYARATLLRSQKMYREAAEDFSALIYKFNHRQLPFFEGAAESYLESGQYANVLSMVSLGLHTYMDQRVDTSRLHLIAARAMYSLGNRETALAEVKKALRIDPSNAQASALKLELDLDMLLCPPEPPQPHEPLRPRDPTPPPAPYSGDVPECRPS